MFNVIKRLLFSGGFWAALFIAAFATPACAAVGPPPLTKDTDPTFCLLQDTGRAELVEISSQALPSWRKFKEAEPALVLLSDRLPTVTVPKALQKRVDRVVQRADQDAIWNHSPYRSTDPALLSSMTLRAALENRFFSRIVWFIPVPKENRAYLSLSVLRDNLLRQNALTPAEAERLEATPNGFETTLSDVPLLITYVDQQLDLKGPCIVHVDLDYITPLYKSEVKSPLFPLVNSLFGDLRAQRLSTLLVTLSYSSYDKQAPLTLRFLGPLFSQITKGPTLLEKPMPRKLQLKRDNLYLANFFQIKEVLANASKAYELDQDDPSCLYDLYLALKLNDRHLEGLGVLEDAITRDAAYGLEYLALAQKARSKSDTVQAERYLRRAHELFPDDPIIALLWIEGLKQTDKTDQAEQEMKKLADRKWSTTYYSHIIDELNNMAE